MQRQALASLRAAQASRAPSKRTPTPQRTTQSATKPTAQPATQPAVRRPVRLICGEQAEIQAQLTVEVASGDGSVWEAWALVRAALEAHGFFPSGPSYVPFLERHQLRFAVCDDEYVVFLEQCALGPTFRSRRLLPLTQRFAFTQCARAVDTRQLLSQWWLRILCKNSEVAAVLHLTLEDAPSVAADLALQRALQRHVGLSFKRLAPEVQWNVPERTVWVRAQAALCKQGRLGRLALKDLTPRSAARWLLAAVSVVSISALLGYAGRGQVVQWVTQLRELWDRQLRGAKAQLVRLQDQLRSVRNQFVQKSKRAFEDNVQLALAFWRLRENAAKVRDQQHQLEAAQRTAVETNEQLRAIVKRITALQQNQKQQAQDLAEAEQEEKTLQTAVQQAEELETDALLQVQRLTTENTDLTELQTTTRQQLSALEQQLQQIAATLMATQTREQELREKKATTETVLEDKTTTLASHVAKLEEAKKNLQDLEAKLVAIQEELQATKAVQNLTEEELSQKLAEHEKLVDSIRKSREEQARLTEQLQTEVTTMTDALETKRKSLQEHEANVASLEQLLEIKTTAVKELDEASVSLSNQVEQQLEKQRTQAAQAVQTATEAATESEAGKLQETKQTAKQVLEQTNATLTELQAEQQKTSENLAKTEAEVATLRGQLGDKITSLKTLRTEMSALETDLRARQTELTRAGQAKLAFETQLTETTKKDEELRNLKETHEARKQTEAQIQKLTTELKTANETANALTERKSALEVEVQTLSAQNAQLAADLKAEKQSVSELTLAQAGLVTKQTEAQERATTQAQKITELENQLTALTEKLTQQQEQTKTNEDLLKKSRAKAEKLQLTIKQNGQKYDELKKAHDEANDERTKAQATVAQLTADKTALEAQAKKLEAEKATLEQEQKKSKEALNVTNSEKVALKRQLEQQAQALADAQQLNTELEQALRATCESAWQKASVPPRTPELQRSDVVSSLNVAREIAGEQLLRYSMVQLLIGLKDCKLTAEQQSNLQNWSASVGGLAQIVEGEMKNVQTALDAKKTTLGQATVALKKVEQWQQNPEEHMKDGTDAMDIVKNQKPGDPVVDNLTALLSTWKTTAKILGQRLKDAKGRTFVSKKLDEWLTAANKLYSDVEATRVAIRSATDRATAMFEATRSFLERLKQQRTDELTALVTQLGDSMPSPESKDAVAFGWDVGRIRSTTELIVRAKKLAQSLERLDLLEKPLRRLELIFEQWALDFKRKHFFLRGTLSAATGQPDLSKTDYPRHTSALEAWVTLGNQDALPQKAVDLNKLQELHLAEVEPDIRAFDVVMRAAKDAPEGLGKLKLLATVCAKDSASCPEAQAYEQWLKERSEGKFKEEQAVMAQKMTQYVGELNKLQGTVRTKEVDEAIADWQTNRLQANLSRIINLYEDLTQAKVRIYLRLSRGASTQAQSIQVGLTTSQCVWYKPARGDELFHYGRFYSVFDNEQTNQALVSDSANVRSLGNLFAQVANGYSNVLFGYGASGSGKTFTLFGDGDQSGITTIGLQQLDEEFRGMGKRLEIGLVGLFEVYGIWSLEQNNSIENFSIVHVSRNLSDVVKEWIFEYGRAKIRGVMVTVAGAPTSYEREKEVAIAANIDAAVKQPLALQDVPGLLNSARDTKQITVRCTPGNPHSSRGFVFLVFEVHDTTTDTKGFLSVVDMAGAEDPFEIMQSFYDVPRLVQELPQKYEFRDFPSLKPVTSLPREQQSRAMQLRLINLMTMNEIDRMLTPFLRSSCPPRPSSLMSTDVYSLMMEGFYINENLHLLRQEMLARNNLSVPEPVFASKFAPTTWDYDPSKRLSSQEPSLFMKMLDHVSKLSPNPAKFVMLMLVRTTQDMYGRELYVKETLDFAQKFVGNALCQEEKTQ